MLVGDEDRDRDRHEYLPVCCVALHKREAFGLAGSRARAAHSYAYR